MAALNTSPRFTAPPTNVVGSFANTFASTNITLGFDVAASNLQNGDLMVIFLIEDSGTATPDTWTFTAGWSRIWWEKTASHGFAVISKTYSSPETFPVVVTGMGTADDRAAGVIMRGVSSTYSQVAALSSGIASSPRSLAAISTPGKNVTVCYVATSPSSGAPLHWENGFTRAAQPGDTGSSIAYRELPASAGTITPQVSWLGGGTSARSGSITMSFTVI